MQRLEGVRYEGEAETEETAVIAEALVVRDDALRLHHQMNGAGKSQSYGASDKALISCVER